LSFDCHRAMTDAVVDAPEMRREHLALIMTPEWGAIYR